MHISDHNTKFEHHLYANLSMYHCKEYIPIMIPIQHSEQVIYINSLELIISSKYKKIGLLISEKQHHYLWTVSNWFIPPYSVRVIWNSCQLPACQSHSPTESKESLDNIWFLGIASLSNRSTFATQFWVIKIYWI